MQFPQIVEAFIASQEAAAIITKAFLILLFGFLFARVINYLMKAATGNYKAAKYAEYMIMILAIFGSLAYMSPQATQTLLKNMIDYLPIAISAVLILVIGILVVNIILAFISWFFQFIKFEEYLSQLGVGSGVLFAIKIILSFLLYLVVIQIFLVMLGISQGIAAGIVSAIGWAVVLVIAGLILFGAKDLVRDWLASLIIKSSKMLKVGQRVFSPEFDGEVVSINPFTTILDSGKGYYISLPNSTFLRNRIMIQKSKFDLKSLEAIRKHYIAQEPSYCAPASADMMLSMFGYDIKGGQRTIAKYAKTKVPGGTNAQDLINAIAKLTDGNILGLLIPYKNIINLKEEIKSWLADGGLVIINFYKAALFPGIKRKQKHAVLCIGVEGDHLLIMDPNPETGGVYLVHYKDMERAIGPFEGEERGYVAYAPKGTRAYWRIKNKLYYSNPMYYEKLTKTFERKLKQIFRENELIQDILPDYINRFVEEYKSTEEERIKRLWSP